MSDWHENQIERNAKFDVIHKSCNLLYITFSIILLKTDSRDIGLYLDAAIEQLFLKSGMILANFMFSGNMPDVKDLFIIKEKELTTELA